MDHAFLLTHGFRESGMDPRQNEEGRAQIKHMAEVGRFLQRNSTAYPRLIVVGDGRRFKEVSKQLQKKLFRGMEMRVMVCELFGTAGSMNDHTKTFISGDGQSIPKNQRLDLPDLLEKDWAWKILEKILKIADGDAFICTGRPWMELLLGTGASKSASIYQAIPRRKDGKWIMEHNELTGAP